MMKKFALWSLALLLTFAAACSDYDDTELWNSVNDIKKRVEALETAVAKLNSDVSAMQTLIEKLNEKVYVSRSRPTPTAPTRSTSPTPKTPKSRLRTEKTAPRRP